MMFELHQLSSKYKKEEEGLTRRSVQRVESCVVTVDRPTNSVFFSKVGTIEEGQRGEKV